VADADYDEILLWTAHWFDAKQASAYADLLSKALARLERGPDIPGAREREDTMRWTFPFMRNKMSRLTLLIADRLQQAPPSTTEE
jgi:plasmid stabilization system protein ParE